MKHVVWPIGLVLVALARPAGAQAPERVDYQVQPGDTCAAITRRVFGDDKRWDILHEYNPQLGPKLPHRLVPGLGATIGGQIGLLDARMPVRVWCRSISPPAWSCARGAATATWSSAPVGYSTAPRCSASPGTSTSGSR